MPLVIVESPTKAKTIGKFLGGDYQVVASFGHVRDLPKSKLGIDVAHNFALTYAPLPKAKAILAELKKLAATESTIILATDEDREGEAIAWHLAQALGLGSEERRATRATPEASARRESEEKQTKSRSPCSSLLAPRSVSRIVFHEITKTAITEALQSPRAIDLKLVDAQQARRVLDRLVGYELSPFLWRKVRYGLSAGRVQSVAVRLVAEREREIQAFQNQEYWSIEALFTPHQSVPHGAGSARSFPAKLQVVDGKTLGKLDLTDQTAADRIVQDLQGAAYQVGSITVKEAQRYPAPPFITSTLQQEAARKLGYSAKQTMMHAQRLYENGFITYMRTDSVQLASAALTQARIVIAAEFGKEYQLAEPRHYANRSKGAQEAHEAIRPTDLALRAAGDNRNERLLYELIRRRTLACQMQSARVEQTAVDIKARSEERGARSEYAFRATGQVVIFDGFLRAYTEGRDENGEDESAEGVLPKLTEGEVLKLEELTPKQHFTEPPPRYTDATLIKALENAGVGRPSTYAPTLSTIQDREYVVKEDKKYWPTEIGLLVNDLLVEHFPEIVDINFTSHIEEELDDIAEGKVNWVEVCREFYEPFKKHLIEKEKEVEKQVQVSDTPCPHCGEKMIIKFGRMGKFLACPEPGSKVAQPLPEEAAMIKALQEKTQGELCPLCGGPMTVRRGRFGYFLGCSRYPECKGIMKIWNKTGFKCPACEERRAKSEERREAEKTSQNLLPPPSSLIASPIGDLVERKSRGRGGRVFYGCNRYPDCTFLTNKKPESEADLAEALTAWQAKPLAEKKPYLKKATRGAKKS
ncbi:MAG: type I DNA topoisomerase [Candidatus Liptonbacteria bacterium]|nr:type I DNA topoisomerase [Candidatus Liptonbacteria bacterium]